MWNNSCLRQHRYYVQQGGITQAISSTEITHNKAEDFSCNTGRITQDRDYAGAGLRRNIGGIDITRNRREDLDCYTGASTPGPEAVGSHYAGRDRTVVIEDSFHTDLLTDYSNYFWYW